MSTETDCTKAARALRTALDLPEHERGYWLALVLNHLRECATCRDPFKPTANCCCETSPPEFGGNLPDHDCPLHGQPTPPTVDPRTTARDETRTP